MERIPLLHEKHEFSGHDSLNKMLSNITRFHWEGMSNDIQKLIIRCDDCAKWRPKFREPSTLKPRFKGNKPWHSISIDLTGDMNTPDIPTANPIETHKNA